MNIIDFHSHILPEVDDGSRSLKESIEMLRLEAEQGVTDVVATPHFYAQHSTPERFLQKRTAAEQQLRQALEAHPDLPRVFMGAEVHFFRGMSNSEAILELTINEKRCILIEMPHSVWTDCMYREIEMIHSRLGLIPVLAHIDRYITPFNAQKVMRRLSELPILVQANADFFLRRSTCGTAVRMLRHDQIQVIGSDCHNLTSRKPNLGPALDVIRKHAGEDVLDRMQQYGKDILIR